MKIIVRIVNIIPTAFCPLLLDLITNGCKHSESTISREIMRNKTYMNCKPAYYPHTAQKKSNLRKSYCHRGVFWDKATLEYIDEKLRATWSPEQITYTPCGMKMPSFKTIYRWIYQGYLANGSANVLRRKGESMHGKETRGKLLNKGKSIRKRDKSVYKGRNLARVSAKTFARNVAKINNRPKKVLNFQTPADLFEHELQKVLHLPVVGPSRTL